MKKEKKIKDDKLDELEILEQFHANYDFSNPADIEEFVNTFPPEEREKVRKIVIKESQFILGKIYEKISEKK